MAETCRQLEHDKIPGIFLEAGCALGGSTILLGKTKHPSRPLYVFDVFGQIPPPSDKDTPAAHRRYKVIQEGKSRGLFGDTYYGYQDNLFQAVVNNLAKYGLDLQPNCIELVQGLLQETFWPKEQVAFAHIDVDWYEPVKICLDRLFPLLAPRGVIVLDDYNDWGGCKKAVDEFLQAHGNALVTDISAGSMKLVKSETV